MSLERAFLYEARAFILAALELHDLEHGGEPCYDERLNVLAWLTHSMGFTSSDEPGVAEALGRELYERLRDYEAVHAEHHLGHHSHRHGGEL